MVTTSLVLLDLLEENEKDAGWPFLLAFISLFPYIVAVNKDLYILLFNHLKTGGRWRKV